MTYSQALFAIIFDMDGVLVDTTELNWKIFQTLIEPYGVIFSKKDIKEYLGTSILSKVNAWNKKYGLTLSFETFLNAFEEEKRKMHYEEQLKVRPSLIALLHDLVAHTIPLGIGTSSTKERAEKVLLSTGIQKFFSALTTAEDVSEHKPHPQIFLTVAEKLEVHPQHCIVIEDAGNGIEAAKRGGMKVIG